MGCSFKATSDVVLLHQHKLLLRFERSQETRFVLYPCFATEGAQTSSAMSRNSAMFFRPRRLALRHGILNLITPYVSKSP